MYDDAMSQRHNRPSFVPLQTNQYTNTNKVSSEHECVHFSEEAHNSYGTGSVIRSVLICVYSFVLFRVGPAPAPQAHNVRSASTGVSLRSVFLL